MSNRHRISTHSGRFGGADPQSAEPQEPDRSFHDQSINDLPKTVLRRPRHTTFHMSEASTFAPVSLP
jgi:hypothetical protein